MYSLNPVSDSSGVGIAGRSRRAVIRQDPGRIETVDLLRASTRHSAVMIVTILRLLSLIATALRLRSDLALENLALRRQFAILNRQLRWPKLRRSGRYFWLPLSRSWLSWKETPLIVKPETELRWHRKSLASHWTRLSRKNRPGRPGKDREMRELIGRMASSNPFSEWWRFPMMLASKPAGIVPILPYRILANRRCHAESEISSSGRRGRGNTKTNGDIS